MCLHFLSFLNTGMVQLIEMLSHGRQNMSDGALQHQGISNTLVSWNKQVSVPEGLTHIVPEPFSYEISKVILNDVWF